MASIGIARTPLGVVHALTEEESIGTRALRRMIAASLVTTACVITGAEARWVGCTPSETGRIYFANHTSHADFMLIWSALTPRLRARTLPVAAADYWDHNPVRRYLAKEIFHAVLVKRDHFDRTHNPLMPLVQALDRGNSLILFPEGTRGNGEALQPFKCGIHHLAQAQPDVELVPVWIDNLYRVLPKGAVIPAPMQCSVTFGEPTRLMPGEPKQEFLERLRKAVACLGGPCAKN